ncbi:MAG: nucleotide-binding universal stress UspA family protein [Gammaproteobacteria bacterium]|jgi:nucleotide-binding universal stress UspA family protein
MKTILLPLNGVVPSEFLIDAAVLMAQQYNCFIQAAWCQQTLPIIAGEGITLPAEYLSQFEREERELSEHARSLFLEFIGNHNIQIGELEHWERSSPAANWLELQGSGAIALAELARVFDIAMMHRSVPETSTEWRTTCETVLFEGGKPLLLTSDSLPEKFGQIIVVAWNGSSETARTIAMSQSILASAKEVHIIEVAGAMVPGPDARQVAYALKVNGINVSHHSLDTSASGAADTIMGYAETIGADLILKGAYTHSRLRSLIFGGVTSDIFSKSSLPALFCH